MPETKSTKRTLAIVETAFKNGRLQGYVLSKSMTAEDGNTHQSWGPANRV